MAVIALTAEEFLTMTVTQSFMGKVLNLSQGRISQLLDEGILIRDELTNRIAFKDSLQSYWLSKNATGDTVNFWKERGLHEKAKRELAELKLSKSRGEVYDAATVEGVLSELLTNFRNKLLGLPAKFARQLENKSRAEIYSALTAAIEDELTELSEGVANCDFDEDGGDAEEKSAVVNQAD